MNADYSIGVKRYEAGSVDAHGNSTESWAPPVSVKVYSIAPSFSNEPYEAGREAVVTGLTILAPSTAKSLIGRKDIVVVDGEDYSVEGEIANWDQGPFGWEPGISFTVKRVEG